MIAVDTNVLVRILVQDTEQQKQTELAQELVKKSGAVFVPQMVQVELVWVLEAAYKFEKTDVVGALQYLLTSSFYRLQREESFKLALERFQTGNAGFADSLIAVESQFENVELWTFDRKLSKQSGVIKLTEQAMADLPRP
ncbi:type II toxin-antitoxin system VapC family toxin [Leucothrix pacifica]|uniref:PIN domain-containing protein n=1 Tax=Leucothrix pacifica TaxID=1247513 RepID=A0A317CR84_9GAMM|nr:type II toxin-antitoxin system VapC family toxin [Leucothrix pacifica]PWR00602.1 PIN domain-containing protein [Leucothrix pacifica]